MKFYYGDKVVVIEGFYFGIEGIVVKYSSSCYTVEFYTIDAKNCAREDEIRVNEDKLKLVKRARIKE